MSKAIHFEFEKLKKEFNIAMKNGNVKLAEQISEKLCKITGM